MILPRAACAVAQVVLEVRVAARRLDDPLERLLGERRAAEVRVHDHARRVQHAAQAGRARRRELVAQPRREVAGLGAGADLLARTRRSRRARRPPRADRRRPRASSSTEGRSRSSIAANGYSRGSAGGRRSAPRSSRARSATASGVVGQREQLEILGRDHAVRQQLVAVSSRAAASSTPSRRGRRGSAAPCPSGSASATRTARRACRSRRGRRRSPPPPSRTSSSARRSGRR